MHQLEVGVLQQHPSPSSSPPSSPSLSPSASTPSSSPPPIHIFLNEEEEEINIVDQEEEEDEDDTEELDDTENEGFVQHAQSLEHKLGHRMPADRLVQQNIIRGGVGIAPSIQATQQVLKFQKALDTIDQKLVNRPPKEDLYTHNIIKSKSADSLHSTQLALQFQTIQHKLDLKLDIRPDKDHLVDQNIMKAGIAPSLHAQSQMLKFNATTNRVDHKLENRPSKNALRDQNIIKDKVAPSLSSTQQALKFHINADMVDHKLDHRPTADNLVNHNIIKSTAVHPVIQERQQVIKFKKTLTHMKNKYGSRPTKDCLVNQNILQNGSPMMHETQKKIERQRISSSLKGRLEHRPTREEFDLRFRGYFDSDASSYASTKDDTGSINSFLFDGDEDAIVHGDEEGIYVEYEDEQDGDEENPCINVSGEEEIFMELGSPKKGEEAHSL